MRSEIVSRILEEMNADPWHVKLKRKLRGSQWVYMCYRRHYGPSQTLTIMARHWAERNNISYQVKYVIAQILLFIPTVAVLIHEAGMLVLNFGLLAALMYMGKFLLKPIVKRFKTT